MATPEVWSKRFAAAVERIDGELSRIEVELGIERPDPGPPIPLTHQEAKDRKKIKLLNEIADRLAAIHPRVTRPEARPSVANLGDVRRALRGDPTPPPLRKDR